MRGIEQKTTLEQKLEKLRLICEKSPNNPIGLLALAETAFRRGLRLEALEAYQKVLKDESVAEAHLCMAQMYRHHGLFQEAISELRTLFDIEPGYPEAHVFARELASELALPEDLEEVLVAGCDNDELALARVRLSIARSLVLREGQELVAIQDANSGDPTFGYYIGETRKRLIYCEGVLSQLGVLEEARRSYLADQDRQRQIERERQLELVELEQQRAAALALQAAEEEQLEAGPDIVTPVEVEVGNELAATDGYPDYEPIESDVMQTELAQPAPPASADLVEPHLGREAEVPFEYGDTSPTNLSGPEAYESLPLEQEPQADVNVDSLPPLELEPEHPYVPVEEPAPLAIEPEAESFDFPVEEPEPLALEPEPLALEPEPLAVEPEPLAFEPEPLAFEPEPLAFEPEPLAVEPEPLAFEPEPLALEPEPEELFDAPVQESKPLVVEPEPEPTLGSPVENVEPVAIQPEPELPPAEPVVDEPAPLAVEPALWDDPPRVAPHPVDAPEYSMRGSHLEDLDLTPTLVGDLPEAEPEPDLPLPGTLWDDEPLQPEQPALAHGQVAGFCVLPEEALAEAPLNVDLAAAPTSVEPEPEPEPEPGPEPEPTTDYAQIYAPLLGSIDSLIQTLAKTRSVSSVFLLNREGYAIAEQVKDSITRQRLSEFIVETVGFLEAFSSMPQYWVLECAGGIVVIQSVDSYHFLVTIGQKGSNFGALRYTMDRIRPNFEQVLQPACPQ